MSAFEWSLVWVSAFSAALGLALILFAINPREPVELTPEDELNIEKARATIRASGSSPFLALKAVKCRQWLADRGLAP